MRMPKKSIHFSKRPSRRYHFLFQRFIISQPEWTVQQRGSSPCSSNMLSNIIHTKWNSSFKRMTKVKRLANAHLIISGKKIHSKPLQKSFLSKKPPQYVYPSFTMSSNMLLSSWLTLLRTFRLQRICVMYLDEKYIRRNLPWKCDVQEICQILCWNDR